MTCLKLILVAGFIVAMSAAAHCFLRSRIPHLPGAAFNTVQLVPDKLGKAAMTKRWHNDLIAHIKEDGARYEAGVYGPAPVIIDFRRASPKAHNGILCFLIQGEKLVFERIQKLKTAKGAAEFDVGAVRSGKKLKLMAVAACTPKTCRGRKLLFDQSRKEKWSLSNLVGRRYPEGVVPVAVILEMPIMQPEGQDATIAALSVELRRVMALIDLKPARYLAGLQSGYFHLQSGNTVATDG